MDKYQFHFNIEYAYDLRKAVLNRIHFSTERKHKIFGENTEYMAWDRICAIMDRLEDTICYINELEIQTNKRYRSAFGFYEFINCSYVVIDCIKTMGRIFEIDNNLVKDIEKSQDIFGDKYSSVGCDSSFFSYIRSLCVVHPLHTNHQKEYLNNSQFHCCPFVTWQGYSSSEKCDLVAFVYTSQKGEPLIQIPLRIKQFEDYLQKWINLIPEVIKAKNVYTDCEYIKLKNKPVKSLDEFEGDIIEYMDYLKGECVSRYDNDWEYIFNRYIQIFEITLSDPSNQNKLEKYRNAIRLSLDDMKNLLQNMLLLETEFILFYELSSIHGNDSKFSSYSYNLGKINYLWSNEECYYGERMYARILVQEMKDLLNEYVAFTGEESNVEISVLVDLAQYLEALTYVNDLNLNIPNEDMYRENILTSDECQKMHERTNSNKESSELILDEELERLLKDYGL